jgi:hypothetical protein
VLLESTRSYMALAHVPALAIASTNKAKTIAPVVDRVQGPRIFANPEDKPLIRWIFWHFE